MLWIKKLLCRLFRIEVDDKKLDNVIILYDDVDIIIKKSVR